MKSFGYNNFIRSSEDSSNKNINYVSNLTGEEAKKNYLEEFLNVETTQSSSKNDDVANTNNKKRTIEDNITEKDIFQSVQNNDTITLTRVLKQLPDKVNLQDNYGWSLLMIACQANSIDVAKELLKRGADTSIRDRAGNSAQSLIIKNKNTRLAEIFFNHSKRLTNYISNKNNNVNFKKKKKKFQCDICYGQTFSDQDKHLSSTIHNINLNKHNKLKTWYAIPESNKGYQIMVKRGWNQIDGLGPDGSGKKYPIKTIQKLDKKGLGHEIKKDHKSDQEISNTKNVKLKYHERMHNKQKRLEINFRREFY